MRWKVIPKSPHQAIGGCESGIDCAVWLLQPSQVDARRYIHGSMRALEFTIPRVAHQRHHQHLQMLQHTSRRLLTQTLEDDEVAESRTQRSTRSESAQAGAL